MAGLTPIEALRERIDEIDSQIVTLFVERMTVATSIGNLKRTGGLAVVDEQREQQVIDRAKAMTDPLLSTEVGTLMQTLISLSRAHQERLLAAADAESESSNK